MAIKSICTSNVVTIKKTATLTDAVKLMANNHVGSIIVVEIIGERIMPLGILTDRDIALTIGNSQKPGAIKVEQVMQSAPVTISENDGIYEAIFKMQEFGVKRLPVIQADGSLIGIVSKDDILKLIAEEINHLSKINVNQIRNEQGLNLPVGKHL